MGGLLDGVRGAVRDEAYLWEKPIVVFVDERRRPFDVLRARAARTAAFGLVVAMHCSLLLLWRPAKLSTSDVASGELGASGMMVSLIAGRLGIPAVEAGSDTQTSSGTAVLSSVEPASASGNEAATPTPANNLASVTSAASAPSKGGLANDDGAGASASVGVGYDPWAQASLAPRLLKVRSEPGLWEQVARCWRGNRPAAALPLTVVLGEGGAFMGAYPQAGAGLAVSASGDSELLGRAIDALKACAPYRDVPTGLANRLTLVVPAAALG